MDQREKHPEIPTLTPELAIIFALIEAFLRSAKPKQREAFRVVLDEVLSERETALPMTRRAADIGAVIRARRSGSEWLRRVMEVMEGRI